VSDLYSGVVGQDRAVAALRAAATRPVHAYLFTGPPGVGREEAARAFAASLLCHSGGCGSCETCTRVMARAHPDVVVTERSGAALLAEEADDIVRRASLSPSEGARQVLVVEDAHLAEAVAPKLLKTIEEPPPSTVFVLLADFVPPGLVTIASRCVAVEFGPVAEELIASTLVAEGVDAERAQELAAAAGGRLDRARLLAQDPGALERHRAWMQAPSRLDGTGAAAARLAEELIGLTDSVLDSVRAAQAAELAELRELSERYGRKPPPAKEIEKRHNRALRRARTDELRSGLATLAAAYRDRLPDRPGPAVRAVAVVDEAARSLTHNPNEALWLQATLLRLPVL
jgi:DNA polymerase III subunit delta'